MHVIPYRLGGRIGDGGIPVRVAPRRIPLAEIPGRGPPFPGADPELNLDLLADLGYFGHLARRENGPGHREEDLILLLDVKRQEVVDRVDGGRDRGPCFHGLEVGLELGNVAREGLLMAAEEFVLLEHHAHRAVLAPDVADEDREEPLLFLSPVESVHILREEISKRGHRGRYAPESPPFPREPLKVDPDLPETSEEALVLLHQDHDGL